MNLGTNRFIATGYLLVREAARPSPSSSGLLPERILSASACISPQFPGAYAIEWDTNERRAEPIRSAKV